MNKEENNIEKPRLVASHDIHLDADYAKWIAEERWGSGVVEQVSLDLQKEFPQSTNFSVRNLWYMKQCFLFYTENIEKLKQLVSEILPDKKLLSEKLRRLSPLPGNTIMSYPKIVMRTKKNEVCRKPAQLDSNFATDIRLFH